MANNFNIPLPPNPVGQAQKILKGAGLAFVKPKFFKVDLDKANTEQAEIERAKIDYSKSLFGTPIFDVLQFEEVQYQDDTDTTISIGNLHLEIALFDINLPRNIVTTKITGRNGKVFEYMSNDDYQINVKGSLVNNNNGVPPETLIRHLRSFCEAPISLKVSSNILSYFDIYTIVINPNAKFTQREGARNIWDYEFSAESETSFEIKTKKQNNQKSIPFF